MDHLLINKIDKLQKMIERKQDKVEFLEEHSSQLLSELQKKSRIIQSLIMKHEPGGLTSHFMDDNKVKIYFLFTSFEVRNCFSVEFSEILGNQTSCYDLNFVGLSKWWSNSENLIF